MMNPLNAFEEIAERARDRHVVLTEAMIGTFINTMQSQGLNPRAAKALKSNLIDIASTAIETERALIRSELKDVSNNALQRLFDHLGVSASNERKQSFSDVLSELEDASDAFISDEIIAQISRDINQLVMQYRALAIKAITVAEIHNISRAEAEMRVQIETSGSAMKLWFKDRAGRKIQSHKFIRRLWRQIMRDHWVAVYVHGLSVNGHNFAVLHHPEPQHFTNGMVMQLDAEDYGLADIDKVFHPGSRALPMIYQNVTHGAVA